MKKKIIIWTLIIVMSLSGIAATVLLLVNNEGNLDIGVFQENGSTETSDMDDPQAETGDDIGNQDPGQDNENQDTGGEDSDDEDQEEDSDDDTEYLTVCFETNGGDAVNSIKVIKGETLSSVPVTQKYGALFDGWYSDTALTEQFYQSDSIDEDITLYAKYDEPEKNQTRLYEKYTLSDQQPDLTFTVNSEQTLSTAEVLDLLTLEIANGSKYITLTASGSNPYTISADGGFTPGATYVLTLGEGLTFDGQPESCRKCSFNIHKDEVMNLKISGSLIYIDADEVEDIEVDGESVEKLSSGLFGDDSNPIEGTFTYSGGLDLSLEAGSVICLYIGTHPNDRNLDGDYTGEDIAYVRITVVNGTTIHFESITEEDAEEVLFMPDTFPLNIDDFAEDEFSDYNFDFIFDPAYFSEFADMGIDADTTVDAGDFIALYDDSDPDFADYFVIDTVTSNGDLLHITFEDITLEEIMQAMEYFTQNSRSGEEMLENVNVNYLESQIETQALKCGFAQKSLDYLAVSSVRTDGFKEVTGVEDIVLMNENGQPLSGDEIELWQHGVTVTNNGITVTATISNAPDHFSEGVKVALQVSGEYTVDVGDGGEMTIEISATFVEEVSIGFGVDGSVEWGWYAFIPYIKEVRMSAYVDVYDFTGISFNVKIQTHEAEDDSLNYIDITEQLKGLLDIVDPDELDAGVEDLFEKYCEMLKTETDYIEIFNKSVFSMEGAVDPLHIIAYSIEVNFKIYTDINIMLGANMEYMSGTRYIFWFKVFAGKAGSSTVDLIPETFQFQFYVMGKLGLKVGLEFKFAVGLFSTHLDSIGLSAEVGPYLELYGYFIYEYSMLRPVGAVNSIVTEEMMGALYIEFGIYFESYFNAEALDTYSYSYELYSDTWELLTAGVRGNVYDFAYDIGEDETYVIKDATSAVLPSSYRNMSVLDLKRGYLYQDVYTLDKYNYRLSNSNFTFNAGTGQIAVNVPSGVQYMECDLTLTWKVDKLTFRKNDLTSTIHLVWTSLTNEEMVEKYEVSVKVGGTTVWSDRVFKNSVFELPSEEEIKELIGYDDDTAVINGETVNLRYASCEGYRYITSLERKVYKDTVYYFDVTEKDYTIQIDGVQNEDGTTRSQPFTAGYNETFDLSALESTGTNDSDSDTYTIYVRTDCSEEDGKQATDVINRDFAIQLIEDDATYTAVYADNSCKVTYHFITDPDPDVDIGIKDVVKTIAKGTRPSFDYTAYLDGLSPRYMVVEWEDGISPGKVTSDTTFTAHCEVADDVPKYTVSFEENGGSDIEDCQRYFGAPIDDIETLTPEKTGYAFVCWCEDEELLTQYTFDRMPDNNLTLYAKWEANEYTVEFDYIAGEGTSVDPADKNVTYNSAYGELPTPSYDSDQYYFLGWFTSAVGGTEVTSDTIMSRAENHTLYAQYNTLIAIPETDGQHIVWNTQEGTYSTTWANYDFLPDYWYPLPAEHPYTLSFKSGTSYPTDGYTVWYRREGLTYYTTNVPTDAGNYYIRVTRNANATHQSFEATSTTAVLIVHQAQREYVPPAPDYKCIGAGKTFALYPDTVWPYIWNDPYILNDPDINFTDGYMRYAATKTPVRPDADSDAWVPESQLGYDELNITYYLWTKIDGSNYTDAFSETYIEVFVEWHPGGP